MTDLDKRRPIRVDGSIAYVPLTQGYQAVIDAADVPLVDGYFWNARVIRRRDGSIRTVYAQRRHFHGGKWSTVKMHREIMAAAPEVEIDHKDCDGLNNRRANLREASHVQNTQNARTRADSSSGFRGVYWHKAKAKWVATIQCAGVRRQIGAFSSAEDAAAAYAAESAAFHGEFGRTA